MPRTTLHAVGPQTRKVSARLLLDLLIIVVLLLPALLCEFVLEPFRRGFFCDDETIRYPFRDNTVTPAMLGVLLGAMPIIVFIVVEIVPFYRRGELSYARQVWGFNIPIWLIECVKHFIYHLIGLLLTFDVTDIGKFTIGRLRPHFIAVCQPQFADGSTCSDPQNQHRYMEDYICVGGNYAGWGIQQSRLSFPSGHSSLTFFVMVYLAIYIHYKFTWRGSKLLRPFLQFCLLMVGWFTALSRVMDHWHHWSDVLFGSLIGITIAVLTARYIAKLGQTPALKASLPRQDTTTTLQDVISTPPPYCVEHSNSFSNEQYSLDSSNGFTNEQYMTKV